MSRKRIEYIDFLSGIFIFQMILGHIFSLCHIDVEFVNSIFVYSSFYVAYFYFKSGMFYHNTDVGFGKFALKSAKRLVLPFCFFTLIGCLVIIPLNLVYSEKDTLQILVEPIKIFVKWGGELEYAYMVFVFLVFDSNVLPLSV